MEYTGFDPNFGLAGKVAVVTGAAQGIGQAIALLFADKGADLVLADLQESVQATTATVMERGRKAVSVISDLTTKEGVTDVVETAMGSFGKVDILVNSAGVVFLDDAENISEQFWDTTMAVNLKAPFMLSQAIGRHMIEARTGNIINIASQAGLVALDNHIAYCASKAAIISMTKNFAMEWGQFNINVNAISPTVILTELGKKAWAGDVGEAMKKKIPAGRFGYPEEVAAVALFLASDAAGLITGENIVIDGGYTIQ